MGSEVGHIRRSGSEAGADVVLVTSRTRMVKRVMDKLIPFSGMADEPWEVFVIEDPRK